MNKSKEVAGCLLVSCRHPPVLLDQVDEPLDLLAFLVHMLVIITRHLPVLLRRDDGLGPPPLRSRHDRVAVVRLVEDVGTRLGPLDQRPSLRNFLVEVSEANAAKLEAVLTKFGFGSLGRSRHNFLKNPSDRHAKSLVAPLYC